MISPVAKRLSRGNFTMGLLFAITLLFTACISSPKLTESNFKKIHNGMTRSEVEAILGKSTVFTTQMYDPNPSAPNYPARKLEDKITYLYRISSVDVGVVFIGDKVVSTEGTFK